MSEALSSQDSSVSCSPNGKHVSSGSWDKSIRIWETSTGTIIVERRLRRLRREKYFLFARRRHDCSWVFQRKNSSVGHCNGRSKAFGDQALTSAQHDSIKLGKLPIVRHKASKVPLYSMNPSWFHLILAPVPARLVESGNYNLTLEAPDSEDLAQRMIRDSAGFRYNGNHYHGRKQSMAPQSSHTKALRP